LKAEIDVLSRRLRRRNDRPLLKTADPTATLASLLAARNPVYGEANVIVMSRDVPHDVIVEEILAALRSKLGVAEPGCRKDEP
jgi:shikimate kinase